MKVELTIKSKAWFNKDPKIQVEITMKNLDDIDGAIEALKSLKYLTIDTEKYGFKNPLENENNYPKRAAV